MRKQKQLFRRGIALLLSVSMFASGNVASASSAVAEKKEAVQAQQKAEEAALREAVRDSDEVEAAYPNGKFGFLATQYSVKESDQYIEIGVMRQGGTKGEVSVLFRAIDVTTSYGDDYKIYQSKKKNSPMKKGEDAFPLIETAYTENVDLSGVSAEELVGSAADFQAAQLSEEVTAKKAVNPLDAYEDADRADAVDKLGEVDREKSSDSGRSDASTLKQTKEQATGTESDRQDWKVVADGSAEETAVRENYDLFLATVGGSDLTLTFEEGEYIKYLYLFPEDDKLAEADEQVLLALLQKDGNAPVGESYHAYVNIRDNEKAEEPAYKFEKTEVEADSDQVKVTIRRTAGTGYYTSLYVGTGSGTANADADYEAGMQKIDFYAGQTEQTVSIDILANEYRKKDRDFYILMSADGEEYLDSACHVIIPANGTARVLKKAASTSAGAESITVNGKSTAKGKWIVAPQDFSYSNSSQMYASGSTIRAYHTGGNACTATTSNLSLYGVSNVQFHITNTGSGHYWETTKTWYTYDNWWKKLWGKKTWHSALETHQTYNYWVYLFANSTSQKCIYGKNSGETVSWGVPASESYWKSGIQFRSQAEAENKTNATISNVTLTLKEYSYKVNAAADKFYSYTYEPGEDQKSMKEISKTDITPTMSLSSVTSNVGNSQSKATASSKLMRSDCLTFTLSNYNSSKLTFQGIQASANGSNWVDVSNNSTVVMNADLFKKLDLSSTSTIYFRPKFTQNSAQVKFTLENKNKGTYTNLNQDYTANVHVGDTIQNIQGKSGAVAAYQPSFSARTSTIGTYKGIGNCGLELDSGNSEGAVAILTANNGYTEVRLSYSNPSVEVQADPNSYRNTYTNLKITVDGKEYDCSDSAQVEQMHQVMEGKYQSDTDAEVSVYFEYLFNPEYKNGKGDQTQEFGLPKYANLSVYTDEVLPAHVYKLEPQVIQRDGEDVYAFQKSGSWKELGWVDGSSATVLIYGSRNITTMETSIEFLGTSADYVMVYDTDKNLLKDTNNNFVSSIWQKLSFKVMNPLETYSFVGMPSDNFVTMWGDFSLDNNNDGSIFVDDDKIAEIEKGEKRLEELGQDKSLAQKSTQMFYGNTFPFAPSTFAKTKLYYTFVKRDTSTGSNPLGVYLYKKAATVLEPDKYTTEELKDASVTFVGTEPADTDGKGFYYATGDFERGKNYLADIVYEGVHFQASVQGSGVIMETINTSELMFPTDFSVQQESDDGYRDTGVKVNGSSFLEIENATQKYSFRFKSTVGVTPNKAKITIYHPDGSKLISETVTRASSSENFTWEFNPAKGGVKPGDSMTIQGIYNDGEKDYSYPPVEVGLVYQAELSVLTIAASFKTGLSSTLKMFGSINTKFDLPLDYDLGDSGKVNTTQYKDEATGADIQTRQIAFGYNSKVLEDLKAIQTEHRADNRGEALSGRDAVKEYLKKLMEDDSDDDEDDNDDDQDSQNNKDNANAKDKVGELSENAESAQDTDTAKSDSMGESSFEFDFSVALILTIESGIHENGQPDGCNYFDSLALVASGEASAEYTVVYTTPIGIDLIVSMSAKGKAVVAFGVEAANGKKYDDIFNLSKNGYDKEPFQLSKDQFSLYTKFLLAPSITVGAGVGLGGGKILSLTISGTADFSFGFTVPILGDNETSSGAGILNLSAALSLKILFIKKSWTLYKSNEIELFNYGTRSVAKMLSDFQENYLYDIIEEDDLEILSRKYLDNRSEWQPQGSSKRKKGVSGDETALLEGVYPYPAAKIVDLGGGKLLMVFVDDQGERDEYNRSELMYTVSEDDGVTWKEPVSVSDDGTWDESPYVYKVTDDKVLVTWSDASRKYTADDKVEDTLSLLDISGAWFDAAGMKMGQEFSITTTEADDTYQDAQPMISFDEDTGKLLVYYTKTDYTEDAYSYEGNNDLEEDAADNEEAAAYGDLVNGYSVIAYRYAVMQDGEFVWNEDGEMNNQYFLDLAVPAYITETTEKVETGETITYENEDGETVSEKVTEDRIVRDIDTNRSVSDPRIVDSDLITYNGLALYAYTMDFDQNLETSDDRQLYVQIYNYETDEFHHPIQITSDADGNSNPKFVRCKDMTYLYWIGGGDIKYVNITQIVRSLSGDGEKSYLKLKTIEYTDVNGNKQKADLYIFDKYDGDPVVNAVTHDQKIDQDGNVVENAISEFEIQSNGESMYLLWTAMTSSARDEDQAGAENVIRETQIFGAYCEPQIELKETQETVTFEDTEYIKYTFAEGRDNTTYPVCATLLKGVDGDEPVEVDGQAVASVYKGDVYTFDYDHEDQDVNGGLGKVKAGDKAVRTVRSISSCDGSDWSKPIQITREQGANYTDVSFRITDDNEIQAVYARGTQSLSKDGYFEEDEESKILAIQTFQVTSAIETGNIICLEETREDTEENAVPDDALGETDTENGTETTGLYQAGDTVQYALKVINDGLKPLEGITFRTYAELDGNVLGDSELEWVELAPVAKSSYELDYSSFSDEEGDTPASDAVESAQKTVNQFLGGNTITIDGKVTLGDTVQGVTLVVEIKDGDGKVSKVTRELEAREDISVDVFDVQLRDENTAEFIVDVSNAGNVDSKEDVKIACGDTVLVQEKDVNVAANSTETLTLEADISNCKYGDVTTNEDGSKQDAIDVAVSYGDFTVDTQVVRSTTAEGGYASDAIQSFEIGASDATDDNDEAKAVDGTLTIGEEDVTYLESIYEVDENSAAAKALAEEGLSAEAQMSTEWSSSDTDVAYVSEGGLLIPMKEGEAEITAITYPGINEQFGDLSADSGEEGKEEGDFGEITAQAGDGAYTSRNILYKIPESLVRKKTIKVKITAQDIEDATPTEIPAATETPEAPTPTAVVDNPAEPATSAAVNSSTKNGVTYKVSGSTATVTKAKKTVTSVVIPAAVKINGKSYKVTKIAAGAFKNCKKLKKVTIGKNVTKIGARAFKGCAKLKKVIFKRTKAPAIGKKAFQGIKKTAVFKVPKNSLKEYKKVLKKKTGVTKKMKIKK